MPVSSSPNTVPHPALLELERELAAPELSQSEIAARIHRLVEAAKRNRAKIDRLATATAAKAP